jgi:hypothetical protein
MARSQRQGQTGCFISGIALCESTNDRDKDSKHRLKGCAAGGVGGTISTTEFSGSGQIFAYAISYDWSKVKVCMYSLIVGVSK